MATDLARPEIILPDGFDARWEAEMTCKGHLGDVTVRLGDGSRFRLNFIDPVRLRQDLSLEAESGRPYFAEPGLIVVPEVTLAAIREAVDGAWRDGFFESLRDVEIAEADGNGLSS